MAYGEVCFDGEVAVVAADAANGFKSAALFKTIGRRIYPHKVLWERIKMLTHRILIFTARVICFALLVLWRTLFLCLDVRALPSRSRKPFVKGLSQSLPRHRFLLWCIVWCSELFWFSPFLSSIPDHTFSSFLSLSSTALRKSSVLTFCLFSSLESR